MSRETDKNRPRWQKKQTIEIFERVWKVAQVRDVQTFTELGKRIHLSRATISMLSRGERNWSTKSILKAAAGLATSRQYLETGTPEDGEPVPESSETAVTKRDEDTAVITVRVAVPTHRLSGVLAALGDCLFAGSPLEIQDVTDDPEG